MKGKLAAWTAVGFAAVILVVVVVAVLSSQVGALPRRRMQQQLAAQLGVAIEDYPYQSAFPDGYFYSALKPGMSIQEVHAIVRGYAKVLHCGDYAEIYYYYDTADMSAHRFGFFSTMMAILRNSRVRMMIVGRSEPTAVQRDFFPSLDILERGGGACWQVGIAVNAR